jgi:hypothetical protein
LDAITTDHTLPTVKDILERWDKLTPKQQRGVIERLIGRIVIAPGNGGPPGFNKDRVGRPEWLA